MPISANAGPPSSTIGSTLTSVSTLLTTVGCPNRPALDRERRLVARLAAVALDRAEDRGLLAADVGAGALAQLDVEREAVAEHVVAEQAPLARLLDRVLEPVLRERVLAAQVEVAVLAAGRVRGDRHRLDQRERVALHDHAVLERARARTRRRCRPGSAGRRGWRATASHLRPVGNAAPPRPMSLRVDHLADHALRAEVDRPAQRVVAAVRAVVVEALGVDDADPRAAAAAPARRTAAAWSRAAAAASAPPQDRLERRRRRRRSARARAAPRPTRRAAPPARGRTGPGTGPRSQVAPSTPRSLRPDARAPISSSEPAQRQAMSSQTCTTRGGRGSTENSA